MDFRLQQVVEPGFDRTFESILDHTYRILTQERAEGSITGGRVYSDLAELEVPQNLAIVGDLHGDLATLLCILGRLGPKQFLSNPDNKLVFLGDYIDRGSSSIDVLYSVFELKCRYPNSVILMRGNHEAPLQFPFNSHLLPFDMQRLLRDGRFLYQKALSLFEMMSLVTVIKNELLMVHGGLPCDTFQSSYPRYTLANANENKEILEEILWNDPRDLGSSDWEKSRRTFGKHFGEGVTSRWMDTFGVKAVVRGHEPCKGYSLAHKDRVLTLFSCKEVYPKFEAAFLQASKGELLSMRNARDLARCVKIIE